MKNLSTTHVPQEQLQEKATRRSIIQAKSYRKANWCLAWLVCVEALRAPPGWTSLDTPLL